MAFTPQIEVDCSAVPNWHYCQQFKQQVTYATEAITAQFKAHLCLQNGYCQRSTTLIDWIENHSFGHHYPEHILPISTCFPHHHDMKIQQATCSACKQVVTVSLKRGSCQLSDEEGFEYGHSISGLQRRCEAVADYMSSKAHSILTELNTNICDCLGCCGTRKCYFPNGEAAWMKNLIDNVKRDVEAMMLKHI